MNPREKPPYDIRIHGDDDLYPTDDDDSSQDITARNQILHYIAISPRKVKEHMIRSLLLGQEDKMGGVHRKKLIRPKKRASSTVARTLEIIQHLGGHSYSVSGDPVVVTDNEHKVLQAFAEKCRPMSKSEIESATGISNASPIMKRLKYQYPGFEVAIRCPGQKCSGGYFAHVLKHIRTK